MIDAPLTRPSQVPTRELAKVPPGRPAAASFCLALVVIGNTTALALATSAYAHNPPAIGAHGGRQTEAGIFHIEAVPSGKTLVIYLEDHDATAVQTAGYSGLAIFKVKGTTIRVKLGPSGGNSLSGTAAVPVPVPFTGTVEVTTRAKATFKAEF